MATEAGYSESAYPANLAQGLNIRQQRMASTTRGSNKRKRPLHQDDLQADTRGSPISRRSGSNNFAQQHSSSGAPTATMGDSHNDNFFNQQPQDSTGDDSNEPHFDLSALQAVQSQGAGGHGTNANVDTAAAALNQHYSMQVPPPPGENFISQPTVGADQTYGNMDEAHEYTGPDVGDLSSAALGGDGSGKPAVGSDEWHKQRKDNHKEVERRRRETINEGINELAKIVPGCEKNKGSILARAVQYIGKLHQDSSNNIEKWTFEKLVTEQALADLSAKLSRTFQEKEAWKRVAREAGVDVDNVDIGLEIDTGGEDDSSKDNTGQKDEQRDGQDLEEDGQGADSL